MRTEDVLLNLASGTGQQLSQWPSSASICCPTIVSGVRFSQTWSFVEKDRKIGGGGGGGAKRRHRIYNYMLIFYNNVGTLWHVFMVMEWSSGEEKINLRERGRVVGVMSLRRRQERKQVSCEEVCLQNAVLTGGRQSWWALTPGEKQVWWELADSLLLCVGSVCSERERRLSAQT